MKLNLIRDKNQELTGYTTVSSQFDNLDTLLVDDGEAEEIRAVGVLSLYISVDAEKVVNHWIRKLKHGGKLTVICPDIFDISLAINSGAMSIATANQLLYNEQRSCVSLTIVEDMFVATGLNIITKRINDYHFTITGERP